MEDPTRTSASAADAGAVPADDAPTLSADDARPALAEDADPASVDDVPAADDAPADGAPSDDVSSAPVADAPVAVEIPADPAPAQPEADAPSPDAARRPRRSHLRAVPWGEADGSLWFTAGVTLCALLACVVPLLLISRYNHSYADDWHYAVPVHQALEAGGGLLEALWAAVVQAAETFFSWQGTYSAIFLMALEPGVFGEQWYVIAAPLVLALLVWGNCYLARDLLGKCAGLPTPGWLSVAAVVTCVELCIMVSPVEGVFWYNSALYYTGYQAIAQILAVQVLRLARDESSGRARRVDTTLLAAFVAGGNFVTAFACVEAAVLVGIWLWFTDRREQLRRIALPVGVLLAGTAASMLAPGNAVRQATQFSQDGAGVVGTITGAFVHAGQDALAWLGNPFALLGLCALVPLALCVARQNRLSYRGLLFAIFVCGEVFVSSYTPTLWSMGTEGPGRVENARMELLVVLVALLVFWLVGRLQRLASDRTSEVPLARDARLVRVSCAVLVVACLAGTGLALAASRSKAEANKVMPVSAAFSLADGSAVEYDAQVRRRLDYLATSPEPEVEVAFYTAGPKVLFMGDVRDNMDNYINYRLAQWFHKDSIIGVYGTP